MSMINCPECGKEISDMAISCPNCGRPLQQKKVNNEPQIMNASKTTYQQKNVQRGKNKKSTVPLIALVILIGLMLMVFGFIMTKGQNKIIGGALERKDTEALILENDGIKNVLTASGIDDADSIKHDVLLDNADFDGETGYRISYGDVNNIILYLNADNSVYSLRYADYDLYSNNATVATIQDYTFTTNEKSTLMIQCEEKVKEILKSPSTADFPNILEWGFKKEKNISTVQGYVDSQNGFGAELRSNFQFIIDTNANTIQSFIFDGQEMIQ